MVWFYLLLVIHFHHTFADTVRPVSHRPVVRQAPYYGQSCQTPSKKSGGCIALKSCPSLYQLLLTSGQNSSTVDFLRRSRCGNLIENRMPVVCCIDPIPQTTTSMKPAITRKPVTKNATTSVNYGECGRSDRADSILALGTIMDASLGDWPWMVAFGYNSSSKSKNLQFKCGATLISNEWVLTAAHCVQNVNNIKLIARLGDLNLDPNVNDKATPVHVPISEIIPHPEYTTSPTVNDIALLRLEKPVKFSKYIRPACLLSGNDHRSDKFYERKRPYIVGWGEVEWVGATSSQLRQNKVDVVNQTSCAEKYATEKSAKIDQRVLCAKETGRYYSCQSGSGCTLFFPTLNKTIRGYEYYSVGGIASFGVRNADFEHPGVYTRVAAFRDWISKITGLSLS